jgi:tetratricopeptide (TPR) repeat protein
MALFGFGVVPLVGECSALVARELPQRLQPLWKIGARMSAAALVCVLVASAWLQVANQCWSGMRANNFPMRASAFVKQMRLPPRLFNDMAGGGYLAWDRPVEDGVYIDGRLEVYGPEFFSSYTAALADPSLWQQQADRLGIRTVVLLHRWTNYQRLVSWLLADARWTLVYFDEVAVVFLRRGGDEDVERRCREAFSTLRQQTAEHLLADDARWPCDAEHAQAVYDYAGMLFLMGGTDRALSFYSRALDLHPGQALEVQVELRLAYLYALKRDLPTARLHLGRAAHLDPENRGVRELRRHIEG